MPLPIGVLIGGVVPAIILAGYQKLFKSYDPIVTIKQRTQTKVFVIHDGRKKEGFPILTGETMFSIMGGAAEPDFKRPNNWRETTLLDNSKRDNIADKESLYSEFSSLYVIWKNETGYERFVGKMHYRSYLNLLAPLVKMDIKESVPHKDGQKLSEEKLFDGETGNLTKTCLQRMGYDKSNIEKIMDTNRVDILTSTPLDFGMSITEQYLACHGSGGFPVKLTDDNILLLRMLMKAGELIHSYNKSHFLHKDDITDETKNNLIKSDYFSSVLKLKNESLPPLGIKAVSATWDEYIGLLDVILFLKGKDSYRPKPCNKAYFKDLFLMRDYFFTDYMGFIYHMLTELEKKCAPEMKLYKKAEKEKGGAPDYRFLAFVGERLTAYYIHYMLTQQKLSIGVIPRAHYEDDLGQFLSHLYPETIKADKKIVPIFQMYKKVNADTEHKKVTKCDDLLYEPISTDNQTHTINASCQNGYAFEKCIGYLVHPLENVSGETVALYVANSTDGCKYKTAPKKYIPADCKIIGYEIPKDMQTDDLKMTPLYLYPREGRKSKEFSPLKAGEKNIKTEHTLNVATFGRTDVGI